MSEDIVAPRIVVFAETEWYKEDKDKVEEFKGILEKVEPHHLPPHSGVGPQVTIFYKLLLEIAPKLPDRETIIWTHGHKNNVLDTHIGKEVTIVGKMHNNQIWPGYLIPIMKGSGPYHPSHDTANPPELLVFAHEEWYKKDHHKIQEFTGKLEKYKAPHIPSQAGHGPVVTLFYRLEEIIAPQVPDREVIIYSHAHHNDVLDQHIGQTVKISGKLHDNQIWPGYLTPTKLSPRVPIPVHEVAVFAHDEWYKRSHAKIQEWNGKLEQWTNPSWPEHGGVGPAVNLFYQLSYVPGQQQPLKTTAIYSDRSPSKVLDKYINGEVKITGKMVDNQIWPGYLEPLYTIQQ